EHMRPLGYIMLPTVEQGDCGLDAMAFWDGAERTDKTWKALRLELAGALEACAEDPRWQVALAACGEVTAGVAIAASVKQPGPPGDAEDHPGDAEGAVRYFGSFFDCSELACVSAVSANLALAERCALLVAHSCALADCSVIKCTRTGEKLDMNHGKRRPPEIRRAQALSFLHWCRQAA
ncbi:MAG: hypothetical protein ACKPKO_34250, partial [Candidatus Fonsibacter sp.]